MITITTSPEFATTTQPPKLTFTASAGGKRVRLFVTGAPVGTKLARQLAEAGATVDNPARIEVFEGDVSAPFAFQPELPGAYALLAQEIQVPTFRGGFKGDTRGLLNVGAGKGTEKVLGETETILYIGQRVTLPLGVPPHTATLALWVWGDTVRPTTIELHGEVTPAAVEPSSHTARTAVSSVTVDDALEALGNKTASEIFYGGTDSDTRIDAMIDVVNAHLADTGVHVAADAVNTIAAAWKTPGGKAGLPEAITKIVDSLSRHMATDAANGGAASGQGSGDWHLGAFADVWRAFEAHRLNTQVHLTADTVNVLPPLPLLLEVYRAFLDVTSSIEPTPAPDENPGATLFVHAQGAQLG
jgi:hypothetical protein